MLVAAYLLDIRKTAAQLSRNESPTKQRGCYLGTLCCGPHGRQHSEGRGCGSDARMRFGVQA
jgi:hypothetical protein